MVDGVLHSQADRVRRECRMRLLLRHLNDDNVEAFPDHILQMGVDSSYMLQSMAQLVSITLHDQCKL